MIRRARGRGFFFWNIAVHLQMVVFLLLAAHLIQMVAWALVFIWCGQFQDFGAAFCHSAVNYTTLGYGDVVMARPWRLLGPMEAMDGMLMAGVSAAILFAVLHRSMGHKLTDLEAGNAGSRQTCDECKPRRYAAFGGNLPVS
jgi:hypothetical protein